MNAKLTRLQYTKYGIFGTLICGDIRFQTLEHAYLSQGEVYVPKVAKGTYLCVRHEPHRLPYVTFMLQAVPDFEGDPVTGILIHIGNYNEDSIGCVLLGKGVDLTSSPPMILDSRQAFAEFMLLQSSCESFYLEVT